MSPEPHVVEPPVYVLAYTSAEGTDFELCPTHRVPGFVVPHPPHTTPTSVHEFRPFTSSEFPRTP